MIHGLITFGICLVVLLVKFIPYWVCFLPIVFYVGREFTQAEYRYIEWYCSRKRANMPWYAPFTLKAWREKDSKKLYWKSILDWFIPAVVGISFGIGALFL